MSAPINYENTIPLDAAIVMADAHGFNVIPLWDPRKDLRDSEDREIPKDRRGKRPIGRLVPQGLKDATRDIATIRSWVAAEPTANYGMVLGDTRVAIDFDGPQAEAWIDRLVAQHGPLPRTLEIRTAKGRHLIFSLPPGVRVGNRVKFAPGLDTRSGNGYTVGPWSRTYEPGVLYTLAVDAPIAEIPPWLLAEILRPAPKTPSPPTTPMAYVPADDRLRDKALRYLERADPAIEGSGGESRAMSVMGGLRAMGVGSADLALNLIDESGWNCRCEPPFEHEGKRGLRRKFEESTAPIGSGDDEPPWPTGRRGPSVADLLSEAREVGERIGDLRTEGVTTTTAEWMPLDPFEDAPRPAFPVDVLPGWLNTWARETATSLQVPEDLTGVLGLAVVSTAGLTFDVDIRASWTDEVTAAYFALPLHSGERKTPAANRATRPILDWEARRAESMAPEILEAQREFAAAKKREKRLIDELSKGGPEALDIKHELALLTIPEIPRPPCILVHDVTPERLAVSLKENGERKAIISTEGELVSILLGKYQDARHPANIDVILKAHDGEALRVERIGRDPVHLERPKMTICMTTQPALVARLMSSDDLGDRGLLPRFWYAYPTSMLGSRDVRAPPVPMHVDADYATGIKRILDASQGEPRRVRFLPEAQDLVIALDAENEPQLAPDTKRPVMRAWLAKFVGKTCRLAALLAIADAAAVDGGLDTDPVVDGPTFRRAARLAGYFKAHAEVLFSEAGIEPVARVAASIQRWAARRGEPFSEKEALRANAGGTKTMEEIRPALAELVRRGYIRRASAPDRAGKAGRLPSPVYDLRPSDDGESSV